MFIQTGCRGQAQTSAVPPWRRTEHPTGSCRHSCRPGSHEQPPARSEEHRRWRHGSDALKAGHANLVAVAIEYVGVGSGKRHPQAPSASTAAARIVGRTSGSSPSPGYAATTLADSAAARRSRAPASAVRRRAVRRVVLPEHGRPGLKDEVEAARRLDERDAAVQREVNVPIVFVAGRPQRADVRSGCPPSVYSVTSAPVSGCDIRMELRCTAASRCR